METRTRNRKNTRPGTDVSLHENVMLAPTPVPTTDVTDRPPPRDLEPLVDPREALFQKLTKFDQDVARAKLVGTRDGTGKAWVEADPEVIEYHFPKGLDGNKYVIYKDVFVTQSGQSGKVSTELSQARDISFGDPRIRVVGLT